MKSITLGELIRTKRQELGIPLREIASKIDLDQSLLSKIERNKLQAPSKVISALALALGLSYEYLQKKYWSERLYNEVKNQDFGKEALEMALRKIEKSNSGTNFELERKHIIEKIRKFLSDKPIEKAWLFGSFARGTASYDSDIDLLVRFDRMTKLDLFDYVGIRLDLEDLIGHQVDLVEEGQELPKITQIIEKEKQLIYER